MKLKKIQLINNPIFGDFEISFTNAAGQVMDTVILAGENWCGKTALLDIIYWALNQSSLGENEERVYEYFITNNEKANLSSDLERYTEMINHHTWKETKLDYSFDHIHLHSKKSEIQIICNNIEWESVHIPYQNLRDFLRGNIKSIYSSVDVNYNTNARINWPTKIDLDQIILGPVKSWNNLWQEITQLFVNIYNFDNADLTKWVQSNPGKAPPLNIVWKRQKRFSKAFDTMLTHKTYKEVYNSDDGSVYEVHFDDHGKTIDINNLSSGEKQIVFRWWFLLKDKKSIHGSTILIDEPEISLHPRRQLDIANFYKKLFTNEKWEQTSQIFFSTHSPFILHNDNRYEDTVIILKKDQITGNIYQAKNGWNQFYTWSGEKRIQEAFDIDLFKTISKPTVFVEGHTDKLYFDLAKKVLRYTDLNIEFRHVWTYNNETKESKWWWESWLTKIADFVKNNPWVLNQKITLIYDCDCKKIKESTSEILDIYKLQTQKDWPRNNGIENMLNIKNIDEYIYEDIIAVNPKKKIIEEKLEKLNLYEYIYNLSEKKQKTIFEKFDSIFKKLSTS